MNEKSGSVTNQAFYLLIGLFILILVLLIDLGNKIIPLAISHPIYMCRQMLASFVITIPHVFPSLLVSFLAIVFLIGLLILSIKLYSTHRYIGKIKRKQLSLSPILNRISQELSIDQKITLVKYPTPVSFCYGYFKSKICISDTLIKNLSAKELKAVLVHEKYHLENKDPLKILCSQIASTMLFFIPVINDIQKYYSLSKEISADQLSIKVNGIKQLRSALIKVLASNSSVRYIAYFAHEEHLEQRIEILTTNSPKLKSNTFFFNLLTSLVVIIAALIFLRLPVHAMENADNTHSYHVCLFNDQCMNSCPIEKTSEDGLFSSQKPNFTPVNYSNGH